MDYLPRPLESEHGPIEVSYLANLEYDFAGFRTFPERHGFTRSGRLDTSRPVIELAGFMQAWLYFGLIAECTGRPFQARACANDKGKVIVEPRLFESIDAWIYSLRRLSLTSPKWTNAVVHARKTIAFAIEASTWFDYIPGMEEPCYAAIVISTKCLIITLIRIYGLLEPAVALREDDERLKPWAVTNDLRTPASARYVQQVMLRNSWCPTLVRRICKRQNYVTAIYTSQTPWKAVTVSHESCTFDCCVAYNVDQETYNTRHVHGACRCDFVSVDTKKLAALVDAGEIPIIRFQVSQNNQLEVMPAELTHGPLWKDGQEISRFIFTGALTRGYTAISHVWSDGLGNRNANAIPLCQFERIKIKSSFASSYFWMDTLCVPAGEEYEATRLKAIDQMAMIYASSTNVVVLDSTLSERTFPTTGPPTMEYSSLSGVTDLRLLGMRDPEFYLAASGTLGHILRSPWAGRSWTLQEAVLPEHVDFALNKSAFNSELLPYLAQLSRQRVRLSLTDHLPSVVRDPKAMIRRVWRAAASETCLKQAYHLAHLSADTNKRRGWRQILGTCLFLAAVVGALEMAVLYLLYVFVRIVVFVITVPFVAVVVGIAHYRQQRHNEWIERRTKSNNIRNLLCLYTFRSLAKEIRHLVHDDNRDTTATAHTNSSTVPMMRAAHFLRVWESLAERSTSQPEDVHYILATLTHLHIQPLKLLTPRQRLLTILRSFEEVPAGVLFLANSCGRRQGAVADHLLPLAPCGDRIVSTSRIHFRGYDICFRVDSCAGDLRLILLDRLPLNDSKVAITTQTPNLYFEAEFDAVDHLMLKQVQETDISALAILYCNTSHNVASHDGIMLAAVFSRVEHTGREIRLRFRCHSRLRRSFMQSQGTNKVTQGQQIDRVQCVIIKHDILESHNSLQREDIEPQSLNYHPPLHYYGSEVYTLIYQLMVWNFGIMLAPGPVYSNLESTNLVGSESNKFRDDSCDSCSRDDDNRAFRLIFITFMVLLAISSALVLLFYPVMHRIRIKCRTAAYKQYYGTTSVKSPHRFWQRINAFMEAWDAAIRANYSSYVRDAEQPESFEMERAQGKGRAFNYIMGQREADAGPFKVALRAMRMLGSHGFLEGDRLTGKMKVRAKRAGIVS